MSKKIVHLSDTSHPFTSYTDESDNAPKWERSWHNNPKHNSPEIPSKADTSHEYREWLSTPDESDKTSRTLTSWEFDAIRAFQSNWGYVGNHDISDDLVDMLADTHTPVETLISRFLRKWDLTPERDYNGIRTDVQNLFVLRTVVETPRADETDRVDEFLKQIESDKPVFSADEVKALESLPGEKSDAFRNSPSVAELIRERNKRVERVFIGQMGEVWIVYHITDIPESADNPDYAHLFPYWAKMAKDGTITMITASLHFTEEKAIDHMDDILHDSAFSDETYQYELHRM